MGTEEDDKLFFADLIYFIFSQSDYNVDRAAAVLTQEAKSQGTLGVEVCSFIFDVLTRGLSHSFRRAGGGKVSHYNSI